jgi:pre-mRNA-processing factor SLU7
MAGVCSLCLSVSRSHLTTSCQGYDPSDYRATVDRFERIDSERKKYKLEQKEIQKRKEEEEKRVKLEKKMKQAAKKKLAAEGGSGADEGAGEGAGGEAGSDDEKESEKEDEEESDSGSEYDSDEHEDDDETNEFLERDENARDFQARQARQGGVGGAQMKTTVRNLRLREDTPKYLRNLDLNSAFYDPKSRSMRNNPLPNENPENLAYAGDNFIRYTGDALALAQSQILCWEMQARGEDIDVVSNPSQLELVQKQYIEKKKTMEETKKRDLLEKYGETLSLTCFASLTCRSRCRPCISSTNS